MMSIDDATPRMWDRSNNGIASKPYVDPYDQPPTDPVNRPSHYNEGNIECIEYLKDSLGDGFNAYLEGSVKKYLHRFRYKNKPVEDLQKAKWYIERLILEQINTKPK
jgi:hypothetical protein